MAISSVGNSPELPKSNGQQQVSEGQTENVKPSIYNVIDDLQVTQEESEQLGLNRTYDLTKAEDVRAFEQDSNTFISDKLDEIKAKKQIIENNKKHIENILNDKHKLAEKLSEVIKSFAKRNNETSQKYGQNVINMDKKSFEKIIASYFDSPNNILSKLNFNVNPEQYSLAMVDSDAKFSLNNQNKLEGYCSKINITLSGYGSIQVTPLGVTFIDKNGKKEVVFETQKPEQAPLSQESPHPLFDDVFKPQPDILKD